MSTPPAYFTPMGPLTPDLSKLEYRIAPSAPISFAGDPTGLAFTEELWSKALHLLTSSLKKCNNEESPLLNQPPDTLLMILSYLSDASRASLALTCKALLCCFDASVFADLQLPTEQPSDFRTTQMSKPQYYQPSRWEFLRYLERDLKGEWQLCSECFTLHPRRMFAEFERLCIRTSGDGTKASEYRSCRYEYRKLSSLDKSKFNLIDTVDQASKGNALLGPVGIVDLCPCIKLTRSKKIHLETYLRQKAQSSPGKDQPVAADFWWHQCQHTYCGGAIEIEIKIGIFLYGSFGDEQRVNGQVTKMPDILLLSPQAGQLGVIIDYRHTYPSILSQQLLEKSPRLLCPHINLDTAIQTLRQCQMSHHKSNAVCGRCMDIQYCPDCRTKVLNLRKVENGEGEDKMTTCCYQVERCLENRLWLVQTVFPFARRQIPIQERLTLRRLMHSSHLWTRRIR